MRYVALVVLVGCGGEPFVLGDRTENDAAVEADGAPTADSGLGGGELSAIDGGGGADAPAEALPAQEAASEEASACPPSNFPDGGYACGPSWVGGPDEYVCVQKADGGETTLSPVAAFCSECTSAPRCAHCNGPSACAVFGLTFVSCSDDGGELLVVCR